MNNSKKDFRKEKGFTLIELLVVIAIIAILSTVVMAGLNSARQKGRDAKRLADVKQVQAALELFFDSCGGYPPNTPAVITGTADAASGLSTGENDGSAACPGTITFGDFMAKLPINPGPGGDPYDYCGVGVSTSPTITTVPLTPVDGSCETTAGSTSYRIGFSLEGATGSLLAGDHVATPAGVL